MEASILLALQSVRLPVLTQLAALVSALGNYAFIWMLLAIIMLFFAGRRHIGFTIIAAVIITGIIVGFIVQPIVGRVRPFDAGIGVSAVMGVSRSGFSFPSFHAAVSFAAAMVITMTLGRRPGVPAFAVALLIAASRLYLGVEYPTDVLAGAVIGAVIGLVTVWVYNQFLHDIVRDRIGLTGGNRNKRRSVSNARR